MRIIGLLIAALLLAHYSSAQQRASDPQLIAIREQAAGLGKTRTYQYGKAEDLEPEQILTVIRAHGTARQQRQARRLQRAENMSLILAGIGLAGFPATGLFGPADLARRQVVGLSTASLFSVGLLTSVFRHRRVRRLVTAYNDSILAQLPYNPLASPNAARLTSADTLTLIDNMLHYRGMPNLTPAQLPHFDLTTSKFRPKAGEVAVMGLVAAGSLLMSGSAAAATFGTGDYRRTAWTGLGLTGLGFGVAIPLGQNSRQRQKIQQELATRVREHNEFVRAQSGR